MLWFGNLEANSHFLVNVLLHHLDILLDGKCAENVLVVLCLVIVAKLIAHDYSTLGILSLTSHKVFMIQRVALQIDHSRFILRVVLQYRVYLLSWWTIPHDHNICFH